MSYSHSSRQGRNHRPRRHIKICPDCPPSKALQNAIFSWIPGRLYDRATRCRICQTGFIICQEASQDCDLAKTIRQVKLCLDCGPCGAGGRSALSMNWQGSIAHYETSNDCFKRHRNVAVFGEIVEKLQKSPSSRVSSPDCEHGKTQEKLIASTVEMHLDNLTPRQPFESLFHIPQLRQDCADHDERQSPHLKNHQAHPKKEMLSYRSDENGPGLEPRHETHDQSAKSVFVHPRHNTERPDFELQVPYCDLRGKVSTDASLRNPHSSPIWSSSDKSKDGADEQPDDRPSTVPPHCPRAMLKHFGRVTAFPRDLAYHTMRRHDVEAIERARRVKQIKIEPAEDDDSLSANVMFVSHEKEDLSHSLPAVILPSPALPTKVKRTMADLRLDIALAIAVRNAIVNNSPQTSALDTYDLPVTPIPKPRAAKRQTCMITERNERVWKQICAPRRVS